MFNEIKNKKIRKLLKNPKQYFLDIKEFQPIYKKVGLIKEKDETAIKEPELEEPCLMEAPTTELQNFDLVGDNWLDEGEEKPVAILWGFNPWKRKFVSSYLPEYRTAYARGRTPWLIQKAAIDKMENIHFVFWGMSESQDVREYAHSRGIPVVRIEDGFIRSAELGSLHTLPLSLAVDRNGIYFDANNSSDLEHILGEYDFSASKKLMAAASSLRSLFCELQVSKYNLGSYRSAFSILGPKLKRRVLVIGQVDQDASLRYGMATDWDTQKLISLAREENPGSEIIYKPHPDVIQGFRSNSAELQNLQKICRVISEDVILADLFGTVDHVYTMTSLSGFEALLHGLKVTVVGAPFYAGWGLTDDRVTVARRDRKLTLDEMFCGAYLLYPRYLTDLEDPVRGCLAAMLRVTAQRKQKLSSQISPKIVDRRAAWLADSNYWPVLLKPEFQPEIEKKFAKKLLSLLSVQKIFSRCAGDYYQRSVAYFLVGRLKGSVVYGNLLNQLRTSIRPQHFAALLTDLWAMQPSEILLDQWALHCERLGNAGETRSVLNHLSFSNEALKKTETSLPIPAKKMGYVLKLAQYELRQRNLEEANRLFNHLLLSGYVQGDVFSGLAEIARLRFDFSSASKLWQLYNHYDPNWKLGRGHLLQAQMAALALAPYDALEGMALACLANPQFVESVGSVSDVLDRAVGELPYAEAMQAAVEVTEEGSTIGRAKALIAHERSLEAEQMLLTYTPTSAETVRYCLMLSLAYSYQGKLEEAKQLIVNLLPYHPTLLVYREGLRLSVLKNDYAWGATLLSEAMARDLDVGDIYHRKISLGLGDIKGSYLSFRNMRASKTIQNYLGGRYVQSLNDLSQRPSGGHTVILGVFGPGDEIRFASLYREMRDRCTEGKVSFTCDPRLYPMLKRGYPDLEFVPVERIRSLAWLKDYSNFDQLPGSDLHTFLDNRGWQLVQSADNVLLATDALGDVIEGYESFKGTPYLKADPEKIAQWQLRLKDYSRPLVGLSWRSSLTTYSRNEHYLAVQDLLPLFEMEGVQFVNLQYDECSEELEWLEQRFPGKIIHFSDLDQYNDLDGVSALMSCMDLIVAPATTVVELAGALGCPTLLLSNSSELHWRKRPNMTVDSWHSSIRHIEGNELGNKPKLIESLRESLGSWIAHSKTKLGVNEKPDINRLMLWKNYSSAKAVQMGNVWRTEQLTVDIGKRMVSMLSSHLDKSNQQARIVDIGCGTGEVSLLLARDGFDVTGIDISCELSDMFRKNTSQHKMNLIVGDIFDLDIKDKFDGAISRFLFSHYTDFGKLLGGIAACVKPGGIIVFDSFSQEALEVSSVISGCDQETLATRCYAGVAYFSRRDLEEYCSTHGLILEKRISLDFFHRNPMISATCMNQQEYDVGLKEFYQKSMGEGFFKWFNEEISEGFGSNVSGLVVNVIRVI